MQWIDDLATQKRYVAGFVDFMASNQKYIWSTNQNSLQKWSNDQTLPIAEIIVPKAAGIPVCAFGAVWVASLANNSIYKIDIERDEVIAIIETGLADQTGEFSLACSDDGIWLAADYGKVVKIDPIQHQVVGEVTVLPHSYNLTFSNDALWISNTQHSSVQRIDPKLLQVTHTIDVDHTPWFLTATPDYVFTLNQTHGTVSKIESKTCQLLATIQLPELARGDGGDIFASGQRLWVRTTHLLLIEIDISNNQIVRQIQHNETAGSGAVMQCHDHLWITAHDIETVWLLPIE